MSPPRPSGSPDRRLQLTVSSVPETVRPAAARAREAAADVLSSPERLDDLETAVAEALANAVEHGNAHHGAAVTLEVDAFDDGVVVRVCDAGFGRLGQGPLDLLAHAEPDLESERGRGLRLMRRLVDGVEVEEGIDGRVVELWMRASPSRPSRPRQAPGTIEGTGTATPERA